MIKKENEYTETIMEPMFGGDGKVTLKHYYTKDEMASSNRLCAKLIIEPGCSSGVHVHENEEEIFIILKGIAEVNDNGEVKTLKAGDSMLTKSGEGHAIKNIGDETLELVAVITCF